MPHQHGSPLQVTDTTYAGIAREMLALLGDGRRYREEYRKGGYQHSIPGLVLPPWLAPRDAISSMVWGGEVVVRFTTIHNVLFEFSSREDVRVDLTGVSVKITRVCEVDVETLTCTLEGSPP